MAVKEFYHDIDLVSVGQLLNARLHNVPDQTAQDSLAAGLGADNEGLVIFRTDVNEIRYWDGSAFQAIQAGGVVGDVIFKGTVDASVSLDGQVETIAGYQYVVATAGTATATGVTFEPDANAEIGDVILFTAADTAYIFQRNDSEATETILGNVRLATQAEVDAGVQATEAVTPATLQGKLDNGLYTRQFTQVLNLTGANTPDTVSHNLNLVNKDAFNVNVMSSGGSQISVDIDSVDVNSLTLTSLVPLTNVVVTVVGAKA